MQAAFAWRSCRDPGRHPMRGSHMAAWRQRLGSAIAGPRAEMDVRLIAAVGHDSAASIIRDGLPAERIAIDTLVDLLGKRTILRLRQLMKPMPMPRHGARRTGVSAKFGHFSSSIYCASIRGSLFVRVLHSGLRLDYASGIPHSASALFTRKRPFSRLVNGSPGPPAVPPCRPSDANVPEALLTIYVK
jgi:hypothetical protein